MEERIHQRQEPRGGGTTDPALSSGDDESTDDGEFEFPCFLGGDLGSPALADDLFADGRIRPAAFYPVFGRRSTGAVDTCLAATPEAPAPVRRTRGQLGRLFLEESRAWNNSSSSSSTGSSASTSSSAATDDYGGGGLEGAAPESYCVWAPGVSAASSSSPRPPRPRKSGSTGSMARWRRISDLVVGRSHSDGKEKFLFLPANPPAPSKQNPVKKPNSAAGPKKKTAPGTEINTVAAAQRMAHYGAAKAVSAGTPRRTFLPYREELVGFFASVHGISRSHPHPY